MNVTIKAHWCYRGQVLNLAISRCCDPATDLEQIAENAATHALQRLQNRETYPEGLPWSVCHSEGSQFYVIFTPAETAHAGSHTHGETTTNQLFFHIYFLVAEKEEEGGKGGEEIEVLLQKLRCEFTIPDDVITALLPMTTSLSFTERNEITYDNSLGKYIPCRVSFRGGGGHFPLLNPMCPPLEFALHTPTLHGAPLKIFNRPLCSLLQKLLDETLPCM